MSETVRNLKTESARALNFWQALEYLSPQSPPEVKRENCVWEFDADAANADLPWNHLNKRELLLQRLGTKWRFQLYAGIVSGKAFVEQARKRLAAAEIDSSEAAPPAPVACLVLALDSAGRVAGDLFVSSAPWAMACIETTTASQPMNFRGFFGLQGREQEIRLKVRDLMVERGLLARAEGDRPESGGASSAKSTLGSNRVGEGVSDEAHDIAERHMQAPPETQNISGDQDPKKTALIEVAEPAVPLSCSAEPRPVDAADIETIASLVFNLCGWQPQSEEQLPWRVQGLRVYPETEQDHDSPLNSFIAEDLERVAEALDKGNVGKVLQNYLRAEDASGRIDLERSPGALFDGVHPSRLPVACWPGEHPLVTAQQFAVNTIMGDIADDCGMFAINGPPGTGKTTMLRDIVAAITLKRAEVLVRIDRPLSALRKPLEIEGCQFAAYELDKRLRNFGIVVASSLNGAVENVTKELPGLAAIAPGLDIDYFSVVADSVGTIENHRGEMRQRWGLIAAVLGNKANRSRFVSRFWFEGTRVPNDASRTSDGEEQEPDPRRLRSLRDIVESEEHGALPWHEARRLYKAATDRVDALRKQACSALRALESIEANERLEREGSVQCAQLSERLTELEAAMHRNARAAHEAQALVAAWPTRQEALINLEQARSVMEHARRELERLYSALPAGGVQAAKAVFDQAQAALHLLREEQQLHDQRRPGSIHDLFRTQSSKRWHARDQNIDERLRAAGLHLQAAAGTFHHSEALAARIESCSRILASAERMAAARLEQALRAGVDPNGTQESLKREQSECTRKANEVQATAVRAQNELNVVKRQLEILRQRIKQLRTDIANARQIFAQLGLSAEAERSWRLATLEREPMHCATPYEFPALFEARRQAFIAAMALHKAFIVAAWPKLKRSLSAFVDLLLGKVNPSQVRSDIMHLWDAFFLVVPVVSTTFASFDRLFAGVEREGLAWLLIDEAGMASPQQAVGSLWRTRRAVVVGDPLQLEPVVGVPKELIGPLRDRCGADRRWEPPFASVQSLADRANRFGTYLDGLGDTERRWLGSPLLVHRRCLNPMFSIANSVAYDGKMVYGAGEDRGEEAAGPSRWIDMRASRTEGHWIRAQGLVALDLVERITAGELRDARNDYKVYVISPFKIVARKIEEILRQRYGSESSGMVGTVHTFQGKEADHVVFLLGGDPTKPGVVSGFAGAKPNLVNVAVTRARRRLYVVGDRGFWTGPSDSRGVFNRMALQLSVESR